MVFILSVGSIRYWTFCFLVCRLYIDIIIYRISLKQAPAKLVIDIVRSACIGLLVTARKYSVVKRN